MATGKTTVGRLLAGALGRPFSDSDESIERECGRTVSALADEIGVDGMHELEAAHLLNALAGSEPNVVAAAASTIDDQVCRLALAASDVTVIWLGADPQALAGPFDPARHRPGFGRPPVELLTQQAEERTSLFRTLDPIAIETDGRRPEDVVAIALAELANRR